MSPIASPCGPEVLFLPRTEFHGAIKKCWIIKLLSAVLLNGQYIDTPPPQAVSYGPANVHVHVQPGTHPSFPSVRNLCRPGEFNDSVRS